MGIQVNSVVNRTLFGILLLSLAFSMVVARDFLPVTNGSISDTRQVFVFHEKGQLVGISWTGRMSVMSLQTGEQIVKGITTKTIAIYATSERYLGYSGQRNIWYSIRRGVGETLVDIKAGDQNGVVLTNKRVLSFNGTSWNQMQRPTTH